MARMPLTEEQVAFRRLVLNVETVGLTPEQFLRLCRDNGDLRMELTARKELVIMTPTGLATGWRNNIICHRLTEWALKDGTGITLDNNAGYTLPNGAVRAPDASWMPRGRWEAIDKEDREKFAHTYPDFAVELMSPSDTLAELQEKMTEYMANGVQLGWLIDPYEKRVYIYRPDEPFETLDNPATINGDPVLPGFVFNITEIW
jgi:Uma2 family endonuclease